MDSGRFKRKLGDSAVNIFVYTLLILFVFVFVYPFLSMFVRSLQLDADIRNINRTWVLTGLNIENYRLAISGLSYFSTLARNILLVGLATIGALFSCSLAGYGLARFKFPGRNLVFAVVLFSIMMPDVLLMMPLTIQYLRWGWMGGMQTIIVPSFLGFGLRGGLFIYIFRQFFVNLPASYEESARLEGCSALGVFYRVMLPISKTSILVVATLSIVWHWNDFVRARAFLSDANATLTERLHALPSYLFWATSATGETVSPVQLAAAALVVLPILVVFAVIQKQFMAGVEFTGLAN